jgi:hypothetical protein
MDRVYRTDLASGSVSGTRRTTSIGGVIARANLTRTGVFTYRNADGSTRRELRLPEEVFHPATLASFAHVPLTIGHPTRVTPENWAQVAKGHVAGTPERSGKFVSSDIHIEDAAAARDAESGKLRELSCGYTCEVDPTSGVYEGEKYDGIQKRIRGNHVALLPPGMGRAGADVRLHLDASDAVSETRGETKMDHEMSLAEAARIASDARKRGIKGDGGACCDTCDSGSGRGSGSGSGSGKRKLNPSDDEVNAEMSRRKMDQKKRDGGKKADRGGRNGR